MLQLPDIERSTLVRQLIVAYLVAYFAVTLFKLVQSICIIALITLCVWDPVLVGLLSRRKCQDSKQYVRPNEVEDYYPKVQQGYSFPWKFQSILDPLTLLSMDMSQERGRGWSM